MALTTSQLKVSAEIIAPGQGRHDPTDYADLVTLWDHPLIPMPTEAEMITVWRASHLRTSTKGVNNKSVTLMNVENHITVDMDVELIQFNNLLVQLKSNLLTDIEKAQLVYDTKVERVVLIQQHREGILSVLDDTTLDSLDIDNGTITNVVGGWP